MAILEINVSIKTLRPQLFLCYVATKVYSAPSVWKCLQLWTPASLCEGGAWSLSLGPLSPAVESTSRYLSVLVGIIRLCGVVC